MNYDLAVKMFLLFLSSYRSTVKQLSSFQVNWVNTQAFCNQLGIGFYHFFETRDIFSNWVFPLDKLLLVNNLRSNNFLCLSASIFVFITLIVSTQTRHLNTWLKL